jgi:protein phosphatase
MVSSFQSASKLAELATKSDVEEFLELIRMVCRRLTSEKGTFGKLNVTGRLVQAPPLGEAIIVGDLHGDLQSLLYILEESKFLSKARSGRDVVLIFLGDYGDRGVYSPEVYYIVLNLKLMFPERVILMRGNHEGPPDLLASPHDLPIQMKKKFHNKGSEVYLKLRELYNHLYTAVIIMNRFVLLHGGAPSQATIVNDIAYAHWNHPRDPHLEEILWNDPWEKIKGTIASPRGAGKLFGEDVTNKLLKMLKVKALIRGHQSCQEGYKTDHNQKVITLFSRKGAPYKNNFGAYLHLDISQKIKNPKQLIESIQKF